MKYMMLVCATEGAERSPEESTQISRAADAWIEEMDRRGIRLQGHVLADAGDAATVRMRGGELLITDGPFAETKEQVAGYDIIDCTDLDQAIEVAAEHPIAAFGTIEVRPLWTE